MYGGAPYGSAPYAGLGVTGAEAPLPAPAGGGNFMLLGVRSYWWALLLLPFLA